ncbi:Uncharacterised protein [Mycobacteroides abscessus subsp. bolletii]|nr:Uncharacterised protein [Mycobacteroides abscessus subsp. bolletii]SKG54588.1 Uncharacterised protein [Mycobacteroides abscessus subsp. bolletii]
MRKRHPFGWNLSTPQVKAVGVPGNASSGVEVGNLSDQGHLPKIEARDHDSQPLLAPWQLTDAALCFLSQCLHTRLESRVVAENFCYPLRCRFSASAVNAGYARKSRREGLIPADQLRVLVVKNLTIESEPTVRNLYDALPREHRLNERHIVITCRKPIQGNPVTSPASTNASRRTPSVCPLHPKCFARDNTGGQMAVELGVSSPLLGGRRW